MTSGLFIFDQLLRLILLIFCVVPTALDCLLEVLQQLQTMVQTCRTNYIVRSVVPISNAISLKIYLSLPIASLYIILF